VPKSSIRNLMRARCNWCRVVIVVLHILDHDALVISSSDAPAPARHPAMSDDYGGQAALGELTRRQVDRTRKVRSPAPPGVFWAQALRSTIRRPIRSAVSSRGE